MNQDLSVSNRIITYVLGFESTLQILSNTHPYLYCKYLISQQLYSRSSASQNLFS